MARETKIGLLAGLAFIICFAIILSQRGDTGKSTSIFRRSTQTTRNKPARRNSMTSLIPLEQGNTRLTPNRPTPKVPGQLVTHIPANANRQRADADDVDDIEPSGSGADVNLPTWVTTNGNSPETQPRTQPSLPPGRRLPDSVANQQSRPLPVTNYPVNAEQNRRLLEQRLDELNRTNRSAHNAPPVSVANPALNTNTFRYTVDRGPQTQVHRAKPNSPTPPRRTNKKIKGTRYTVVSGDSLSRIAGRHYGRQSHEFVEAIFNANRNVLSDPDSLKVGMKLILPDLKNSNQASNSRNTNRHKPASSNSSPSPTFRWYQIQENDSYVSISRDQLGNGRRWQEIYKLNRDKFPDPHRIRVGVRIKIPGGSGKMASGSNH